MPGQRNSAVASTSAAGPADHVRRTVLLTAPATDVWASLTEPERLGSWFGADVEIDLRRGGRATFRWPGGLERGAVLEEVEPCRCLRFRWLPFVRIDGRSRLVAAGRVELALEPGPDGTLLTVVEWTESS